MATAKKLPSGSWRVQVQKQVAGRTVRMSFTANTKAAAQKLAAAWQADGSAGLPDLTVSEIIERYITARSSVLSPSTIRGYRSYQRIAFDAIGSIRLRNLTSEQVQLWISGLTMDYKPKTVKNIYRILSASLQMFAPELRLHVSLPQMVRPQYSLPSDEDVQKLLNHSKGRPLWIAIMLGRYYGLRRGEICALSSEDLRGDILTINKDMVLDENNKWQLKQMPKTADSVRALKVAEPLLGVLKAADGKFIDCSPNALLNRFYRAQKTCRIERFNFHLLRHAFASSAALAGIPDVYVAKMGGWTPGSPILKTVYQNAFEAELSRQMDAMNALIPK